MHFDNILFLLVSDHLKTCQLSQTKANELQKMRVGLQQFLAGDKTAETRHVPRIRVRDDDENSISGDSLASGGLAFDEGQS